MRNLFFILALLSSTLLWGQVDFGCLTLDFESIPGAVPASGLIISDQYKESFGVTFALEGGGHPVLAGVGPPREAFAGPNMGSDNPQAGVDIGRFFLTDDGRLIVGPAPPIVLTFDIPIDTFGGCILDMDGNERFEIEARNEAGEIVVSETIVADPSWGDGALTCWGFNLPGCEGVIKTITYRGSRTDGGGFGLGMDFFSFCYTAAPLQAIIIPQTCDAFGSVEITDEGADGYTFSFNGGPFVTEGYWDNLIAGSYDILVRDPEGCTTEIPAFIVELVEPEIRAVDHDDTQCGLDNGVITVDAGDTQGPMFSLDGITFQESNVFDSLPPDIYTVYVQDSFGCFSINGATIDPSIGPEITGVEGVDDSCEESVGSLTISGVGENLTYSIDGFQYGTDNTFEELPAGDYTVWIKDDSGCEISDTLSLNSTPQARIISLSPNQATCNDSNGSISVLAFGVGVIEYSIDAANYQSDSLINNLPRGDYTVTIKDENGCTAMASVTVEQPPTGEIEDLDVTDTTCAEENGVVTVMPTIAGGAQYSLDGVTYQSSNTFDSLHAGDYMIYYLDANGCDDEGMISIAPSRPIEITALSSTIDSCEYSQGTITVEGTSENGGISYSLNGATATPNGFFENLMWGAYVVELQDAIGCRARAEVDVDNTPGILLPSVNVIDPECYEDNGAVEISYGGGFGDLTAVLLDSLGQPNEFEGLTPGLYEIMITDELGCLESRAVEVPYPYCPIYIPNVISHQENRPDDRFRIFTNPRYQAGVIRYSIYDRWGELVFLSENFNIHSENKLFWDGRINGKDAEQDSYTYLIEVAHPNGFIESFAGSLMLLR